MPSDRQIRLALWLALLATANANRRHYGLLTTWLPHTVGNTVALSLPEVTAALDIAARRLGIDDRRKHNLLERPREFLGTDRERLQLTDDVREPEPREAQILLIDLTKDVGDAGRRTAHGAIVPCRGR